MIKLKTAVIKYSKKLNITNLSALRSGNISVRAKEKGVDGFYITPSGMKYSSLKTKDIVFISKWFLILILFLWFFGKSPPKGCKLINTCRFFYRNHFRNSTNLFDSFKIFVKNLCENL